MRLRFGVLAGLAALCLAPASALAQTLVGSVHDAWGRPVPGALVRLESTGHVTHADDRGEWAMDAPPGSHAVRVSHPGMQAVRYTVDVHDGGQATIDARLAPSDISSAGIDSADDGYGDEDTGQDGDDEED